MARILLLGFLLFFSSYSMIFLLPRDLQNATLGGTNIDTFSDNQRTKGWAMYSLKDTPAGDKDPFVEVQVVLNGELNAQGVLIINGSQGNQQLIFRQYPFTLTRKDQNETAKLNISDTGVYSISIRHTSGGKIEISKGEAVWFNPFGYLPGNLYRKLTVSGVLAIFYLLVTIGYLIPMILRRKILLSVQYGIFLVLLLGVCEISAWYFYRRELNTTGQSSTGSLVIVAGLTSIKRTAVRVLLLLMAMGVGIIKWTVGNTRIRIAMLALFFLFFDFATEWLNDTQDLSAQPDEHRVLRMLVLGCQALLETIFFYWIILSTIRTIQQLTIRKQQLKLDMYKWFFGVLGCAGLLAVIFIVSSAVAIRYVGWESEWFKDMSMEFLFFIVMTAIAILWRPRVNNTRYGYAEFFPNAAQPEPPKEEEASEILEIISGGELTHRKRGPINEDGPTHDPQSYEAAREKTINDLNSSGVFGDEGSEFFSILGGLDDEEDGDNSLENQLKKID